MLILGIAIEDIKEFAECNIGGSCSSLPMITLFSEYSANENTGVATEDAEYGDFIAVLCPKHLIYDNNNRE